MSIVGSKAYHANNEVKLGNNNYLQREKNFSGYIMYHDLTGKYVNGWVYKNGKIKGTLSKQTGDDLKTELKMAVACSTYEITTYYEQCTLWYKDSNGDRKPQPDEYTNTTCKEYSVTSTYMECQPYLTDEEGGGGYIPAADEGQPCNCVNTCPVCGGCLELELKSAILPGSGGTPTVSCPACSCPKVIDTDVSFVNTKAECVYIKLKNASLLIDLQSAFKLSEKYDLTYKVVANLPSGEAGVIPNAVHNYNSSSNTSIISINAFYFDKEAPVSLAKTILHETIHAKISQKIDQAGGFEEFENEGFEERIKAYYRHYISSNLADHNIIADFYIKEMGKALAGFDGYKYPISYYEALSWHGLYSTTAWNSLSQDKKNQIRNIWDIINSGVKQCN